MSASHLTALVVDDDAIPRRMMAFALQSAGFDCGHAVDGNDALAKVSKQDFDLVVTDLKMPGRHGHSLAMELLKGSSPPVIAVHTSVDDARLAEDLMNRGVDDIVYKPTNYTAFAGKMKGLVSRRRNSRHPMTGRSPSRAEGDTAPSASRQGLDTFHNVSLAELERCLREAVHVLPISHAALELVTLLSQEETKELGNIVQIIERDAALCREVIKVANQMVCAAGRRKVLSVKEAVITIGTRRTGEIAIAISALRTLTGTTLPWLDAETARIQGIAAQIALSHLNRQRNHEQSADGLALSATVHPMGRVLLGTLFPGQYQKMVEVCAEHGATLSGIERSVFPMSHTAAFAELLSNWGVPPEVFCPLEHVADSFSSLSRLAQPVRGQVELLKTAIVVGQCASARWQPWDTVECPPEGVLKRLGITAVQKLIDAVKQDLADLEPAIETAAHRNLKSPKIRYRNLSAPGSDFFFSILSSTCRQVEMHTGDERTIQRGTVVNCLGTHPGRLADQGLLAIGDGAVLVTELDLPPAFSQVGQIVRLPASYSSLESACYRLAEMQ